MKNIFKHIFIVLIAVSFLTSCVNDGFDDPTFNCQAPNLTTNKTVADVYNATTQTPSNQSAAITVLNTTDDIIEAIVTSSDEGGNFYKTISLMSVDGTRGFSIAVDSYNLYTQDLQPGRRVFIKLKDLYRSRPSGGAIGLNFGGVPSGSFNTLSRLSETEFKKFIIPTCTVVDENTIVKPLTLSQLNNDAYLNTLVEVDNVYFQNIGVTYGNNANTATTDKNENITDGTNTFITRTSRFASFSGNKVPFGKGKIRAVLTKFNGTYQLIIRNERDVKMNDTRPNFFLNALNETFESYATSPSTISFPKYINEAVVGTRLWGTTTFGGNKYLQMTSFGSNQANRGLFMIPVNLTAANTLSFQSKAGYVNGSVFKVYYILEANFIPGNPIDNTKLVDITTNFTLSPGLPNGYPTSFTNSGNYNIPAAVTGNGYFVFEYIGNGVTGGLTTTMQIDNIVVN